MPARSVQDLQKSQCKPCEGEVDAFTPDEARNQISKLSGWTLSEDGRRIQKNWKLDDFMSGMKFLNAVAELAEQEGHHPDFCLKNYKEVTIELTTHAIGGLSENDFIVAAKIERLRGGE